jgi:amino acid adenylation domain-containing protein
MESADQATARCVVESIAARTAENSNVIAVVEGYRSLTYEELDARANQLAHLLVERGAARDALVGVWMHRSLEFVVAALGILKARGAYLPLDPDSPPSRISAILRDSKAQVLISHSRAAHSLPEGEWQTVVLDAAGTATALYPRTSPDTTIELQDLAYVIYTSGSTGRPKGVEITHANLANLVRWHQDAFSISSHDRATFQASPGFDAAVWEIWPYLAAGACVYVVDESVRSTPDALRDWMIANGITISFLPTALAQQMLDLTWPKQSALRVLLTGADTLHRHPPANLPFQFVNNYGPTECTVVSTSAIVPTVNSGSDRPTIGKPIANVQTYIVDEQLRQVSPGTAGELLIGGANVGRGYLHLPELTAERFTPDPFSGLPHARLYRTGDLVRQLPNGEIAFIGRIDDQVKIRGYRIEPGEIASVLNAHPDVDASFVTARADDGGESRLVAYVVSKQSRQLRASELRQTLAEQLPDYMIPSFFVQVDLLPQSPNGKVDRAALPLPTPENTLLEDRYEAPQSEIQERLVTIVAGLLHVPTVGINDNFFYLGGHSLLGAQLIARIHDAFGIELSLLNVFDDPTVKGMSAEIERRIFEKLENMSEEEAQRLLAIQDGD